MPALDGVTRLAEVIMAGGFGVILTDMVRFFLRRKKAGEPDQVRTTEQHITERALINVQRSNDELTEDITRTRSHITHLESAARSREEWWQARWDVREERWNRREAELIEEIDSMRERMTALLRELDALRNKAANGM